MIDSVLLFPYWLTLKIRHSLYNSGAFKVTSTEVPSIGIGNVTVGGTGKTPHTEMIIRTLLETPQWMGKNIGVLSRGYKRETRGFQQVTLDGTSSMYGDEPLQIKRKFPFVTVAVDKDRKEGSHFLCCPEELKTSKKGRRCIDRNMAPSDLIIFDDVFQYRSLKPTVSIVLIDWNRPVFKDHLMPMGKLRDLPERLPAADILVVTKCPGYMDEDDKAQWARQLGLEQFDQTECVGMRKDGRKQFLFFTTVNYCPMEPVFPEGESRYLYAKRLVLFTGIANDKPLQQFLSGTYNIVRHIGFADHHKFSPRDISGIAAAAQLYPTSMIATTEKDSQRIKDCKMTPEILKQRMFRVPIQVDFLEAAEQEKFRDVLLSFIGLPASAEVQDVVQEYD